MKNWEYIVSQGWDFNSTKVMMLFIDTTFHGRSEDFPGWLDEEYVDPKKAREFKEKMMDELK